ncbi:MAG: radical SAM protein, partial [Desulfobacterales bacterium]
KKALFLIREIFIEKSVQDHPRTLQFVQNLPLPIRIVEDAASVYEIIGQSEDPEAAGKAILYLTRNRGAFIRECPGTTHYTCCDYMILHVGTYCTMDCAYCVLQGYFHPPVLQYFVNHEDLERELDAAFTRRDFRRIGTGEFTDSLLWERWTDMAGDLIVRFGKQDHMVLELKTKTVLVDKLKHLDHNRKTIVSWSLNAPSVIRSNERGTAALDSRIQAAIKCQTWGYPLAFHFDPLVIFEGGEAEYAGVVQRLFSEIDPSNVAWISLGSFRFPPHLKPIIERRFPSSLIAYGEFVAGLDGKQRYFKPLRIACYEAIVREIKRYAPQTALYFCMEDESVWRRVMGFSPGDRGGLGRLLDDACIRVCGLSA